MAWAKDAQDDDYMADTFARLDLPFVAWVVGETIMDPFYIFIIGFLFAGLVTSCYYYEQAKERHGWS